MDSLGKNPALLISLLNSGGLVGIGLWVKSNLQSLDTKLNSLEEKNKQLDAIGKALVGQNNNLQQEVKGEIRKLVKSSRKTNDEICQIRKDIGQLINALSKEEKVPRSLVKKYNKVDKEKEDSDSNSSDSESGSDSEEEKPKKKGKRKQEEEEEEDDKSAKLIEQVRKNRKG